MGLATIQDMQGIVLLIKQLRRKVEDLEKRLQEVEERPRRITYGGGLRSHGNQFHSPDFLGVDGSNKMLADSDFDSFALLNTGAILPSEADLHTIGEPGLEYAEIFVRAIKGITEAIQTDVIDEATDDAGVTVDGILLKDDVVNADLGYKVAGVAGVDGTFTADGKTVTVSKGLITSIV